MKNYLQIIEHSYKQTMIYIGTFASTIYIMRFFGFNSALPLKYEAYPFYTLGIFLGFVATEYFKDHSQ